MLPHIPSANDITLIFYYGTLSDMLVRISINQERILYRLKKAGME